MWMRRASRGRLAAPSSLRDVAGTDGFTAAAAAAVGVGAGAVAAGGAVGAVVLCEGGGDVAWPFVAGADIADPFASAILRWSQV